MSRSQIPGVHTDQNRLATYHERMNPYEPFCKVTNNEHERKMFSSFKSSSTYEKDEYMYENEIDHEKCSTLMR